MKLYEITEEYQRVFEELSENGIFDQETIDNTLSPITQSFEDKAKNVVAYIKNVEQEIVALQNHKENIDSRIKAYKKEFENLKNYLKNNMINMNINKISCPFFDIIVKDSNPSLITEDELNIPPEYITTKTDVIVDTERLKRDIKNGLVLDGIYIKKNKSLTIKCDGSKKIKKDLFKVMPSPN